MRGTGDGRGRRALGGVLGGCWGGRVLDHIASDALNGPAGAVAAIGQAAMEMPVPDCAQADRRGPETNARSVCLEFSDEGLSFHG